MMNRFTFSQPRQRSTKPWMLGVLSVLSLMAGMVMSEAVQAQSPEELEKYTSVARQIEQQRMQDYNDVKRIMGGKVPENVCKQGDVPAQVRQICDRFDSRSREIITQNGMSVPKFNEITRHCQQSPKPKECPR